MGLRLFQDFYQTLKTIQNETLTAGVELFVPCVLVGHFSKD